MRAGLEQDTAIPETHVGLIARCTLFSGREPGSAGDLSPLADDT